MNELLSGRNQRMKDLVDASRDEIGKEIVDASLLSINVDQLFVLPQTRKRLLLKKLSLAVPVKNDEEHENHITWLAFFSLGLQYSIANSAPLLMYSLNLGICSICTCPS